MPGVTLCDRGKRVVVKVHVKYACKNSYAHFR